MQKNLPHQWFSMIEILVSILIFSLWLTAVYALIVSSLKLNDYNKNYIIASNLAREQIELIKNIRDSNYRTIHGWNQIDPKWEYDSEDDFFEIGKYYTIENNYSATADFPIKVWEISNFWEGPENISTKMQSYRLCLDSANRYTHNCIANTPTYFYRYLKIEPLTYKSGATDIVEDEAMRVTSKVIWYYRGYNDTQITTILTDWKRL